MDLSIVVPIKNEAENLSNLCTEIAEALHPTGLSFEVLVVDDGSDDDSWGILQELSGSVPFLRAVRFQYNCGKAAALSQGFSMVSGDYVVTMDGDLQDNPFEIPRMIELLQSGYDLVSGWKKKRHDPWHKTWPSKLFNLVVSAVAGIRLHDFNCGLKAYKHQVIAHIPLYGDFHRFIPVMAKWRGFKVTEMIVEHRPRVHGVSKYGVSRLISGFLDLLTLLFIHKFSIKPLHFFGSIGLLFFLTGTGLFGFFGVEWVITGALHLRPLMLAGGVFLLMGIQLGSLGLLGEMLNARVRSESLPVSAHIRPKGI
ncbi:MAG TPA: glycosyltransferase family 2 protein [Fibrobacteraceae bacterium]|nr:glycosyltransferase family 2 protein [Fibrobacteraceae bacterium]